MDYDRKSTVSSFYGGRKSSLDALNTDFPTSPGPGRPRDDGSSFFNPEQGFRRSIEPLNGGHASSAGYNRGSFFHVGREEPLKGGQDELEAGNHGADGVWDVYADFNNAGPRYSSAFGQADQGYQKLPPSTPKLDIQNVNGPVEMVTVPAMGPEWKLEEMRDMTKAGKREKRVESRREKWKAWNRGERGMCGRYFTRKVFVFTLFGICVAVAIILGFTIPRVPSFAFNDATPIVKATGSWNASVPTYFNRAPANFSFPGFAALKVNTDSNYIPLKFNYLHATIYDSGTNNQVATGDLGSKTLPAKSFPEIFLPLNFTYFASNSTDATWMTWYDACKNSAQFADRKRPALKFRLVLDMGIAGLPSEHHASTEISNAACPIELSQSSG